MNRMNSPLAVGAVLALLLAVAPTASAIEFSILGDATFTVMPDETFTVDIALDNADRTSTVGVAGQITGLYAGGVVVEGGVASLHHFMGYCSPTNCFAGLNTNDGAFFDPTNLARSGYGGPGSDSVVIISALALNPTTNDGSIDPGLDGGLDEPSARDVTIMLSATVPGSHVLTVGGTYGSGGNQPITNTATITVNVIPEPGTALLVGLGLAGLARVRTKRGSPS